MLPSPPELPSLPDLLPPSLFIVEGVQALRGRTEFRGGKFESFPLLPKLGGRSWPVSLPFPQGGRKLSPFPLPPLLTLYSHLLSWGWKVQLASSLFIVAGRKNGISAEGNLSHSLPLPRLGRRSWPVSLPLPNTATQRVIQDLPMMHNKW